MIDLMRWLIRSRNNASTGVYYCDEIACSQMDF
jgi:hypothetical protein